jgi:hypothetical protein
MAPLRWIPRRPRRFAQIGADRRALLVEAVLWLAAARVALIAVPFPMLARRLGDFVPPTDRRAIVLSCGSAREAGLAAEIGWAVTRAARNAPFRSVCLPQAIAARVMLKRRGVASVMHFGAVKRAEKLDTHAWLEAAGVEVTGYPVAVQYAEIACFV